MKRLLVITAVAVIVIGMSGCGRRCGRGFRLFQRSCDPCVTYAAPSCAPDCAPCTTASPCCGDASCSPCGPCAPGGSCGPCGNCGVGAPIGGAIGGPVIGTPISPGTLNGTVIEGAMPPGTVFPPGTIVNPPTVPLDNPPTLSVPVN